MPRPTPFSDNDFVRLVRDKSGSITEEGLLAALKALGYTDPNAAAFMEVAREEGRDLLEVTSAWV